MEFNWDIDEDEANYDNRSGGPPNEDNRSRRRLFLLGGIALGLVLLVASIYWWINLEDRRTRDRIQAIINLQQEAIDAGDGDLFFGGFTDTLSVQINMLHPDLLSYWGGAPKLVDLDFQGNEIWALTEWEVDGEAPRQKYIFFNNESGSPQLISNSLLYWGETTATEFSWGKLTTFQPDTVLAAPIGEHIESFLRSVCGSTCPQIDIHLLPSVELNGDRSTLFLLSPHVFGLQADGTPVDAYWTMLESRIVDKYREGTVRFAVPIVSGLNLEPIATTYSTLNQGRQIEIVQYDASTTDLTQLAKEVDGFIFDPTLELVLSGSLVNLSAMTVPETDFDRLDLYAQLWLAPFWKDGLWFMPLDAEMSLIFADPNFFRRANVPLPDGNAWDWQEFGQTITALNEKGGYEWGVVARDPDLLISAAAIDANRCIEPVTVRCTIEFGRDERATALDFYEAHASIISIAPPGSVKDRTNHFLTQSSISTGRSALWISYPYRYETDLTTRNAVVLPFPGAEHSAGIPILRVRGAAVSSYSDIPQSTWEWINYLSYHRLESLRRIPVRPSVAGDINFWETMPEPLGSAIRDSFPASRPVRLGDDEQFNYELLTQIKDGQLSPAEAAGRSSSHQWFSGID